MSDPRNVAHAKKVSQEKKHHGTAESPQESPAGQPGKKSAAVRKKRSAAPAASASDATAGSGLAAPDTAPPVPARSAALESSLVVLTKLKELEFHSRAHLERLAELSMTVADELKQTAMAGPLDEVYAAQSSVQTKLTALLESYKDECDRMQGETA